MVAAARRTDVLPMAAAFGRKAADAADGSTGLGACSTTARGARRARLRSSNARRLNSVSAPRVLGNESSRRSRHADATLSFPRASVLTDRTDVESVPGRASACCAWKVRRVGVTQLFFEENVFRSRRAPRPASVLLSRIGIRRGIGEVSRSASLTASRVRFCPLSRCGRIAGTSATTRCEDSSRPRARYRATWRAARSVRVEAVPFRRWLPSVRESSPA